MHIAIGYRYIVLMCWFEMIVKIQCSCCMMYLHKLAGSRLVSRLVCRDNSTGLGGGGTPGPVAVMAPDPVRAQPTDRDHRSHTLHRRCSRTTKTYLVARVKTVDTLQPYIELWVYNAVCTAVLPRCDMRASRFATRFATLPTLTRR